MSITPEKLRELAEEHHSRGGMSGYIRDTRVALRQAADEIERLHKRAFMAAIDAALQEKT